MQKRDVYRDYKARKSSDLSRQEFFSRFADGLHGAALAWLLGHDNRSSSNSQNSFDQDSSKIDAVCAEIGLLGHLGGWINCF